MFTFGLKIKFSTKFNEDVPAYILSVQNMVCLSAEQLATYDEDDKQNEWGETVITKVFEVSPALEYRIKWTGDYSDLILEAVKNEPF